ncbi:MAG: hypothetical protein K2I90_11870, partial [Odoribacter sp.]|nr:hypothetical protein [Odoribacter sp.]
MRKKLFIWGACFSFLIFSCSYELEDLPPSGIMRGDDFGIADARLYFEENATDLSYVHFTEHHASTRADNKEALELSPAWNQAVRSENEEAVLVEVPIGSDLSQISLTRY